MTTHDLTRIVKGGKPFESDQWRIVSHKLSGEQKLTLSDDNNDLFLDGKKIGFCRWDKLRIGRDATWEDLVKELENKDVLTASHFDSMFQGVFEKRPHPRPRPFVPGGWALDQQRSILSVYYFLGTTFRDPEGHLCVPCMFVDAHGWTGAYSRLDREDDVDCYALIVEG